MAKIAVDVDRALAQRRRSGTTGTTIGRPLARGDGWAVEDVICTFGPADRSFEERHTRVSIAVVAAGTFQYRSPAGRALMTPGSLLLGNPGDCFECGHEHGAGDRCIAFRFSPDYFEHIASDAGASGGVSNFASPRVPPVRETTSVIAQACTALIGWKDLSWEEIGVRLAARVSRLASRQHRPPGDPTASALERVTQSVRDIDRQPAARLTLRHLAADAELSPYHFLRTFERLTGVTPHQYVRRARLREAAMRLAMDASRIIDVAFDSGFGDVSSFNRAFRAEFGVSPRGYRRARSWTDA